LELGSVDDGTDIRTMFNPFSFSMQVYSCCIADLLIPPHWNIPLVGINS